MTVDPPCVFRLAFMPIEPCVLAPHSSGDLKCMFPQCGEGRTLTLTTAFLDGACEEAGHAILVRSVQLGGVPMWIGSTGAIPAALYAPTQPRKARRMQGFIMPGQSLHVAVENPTDRYVQVAGGLDMWRPDLIPHLTGTQPHKHDARRLADLLAYMECVKAWTQPAATPAASTAEPI